MTNTDKRAGWDRMPGNHDISNGKGKTYRGLVRFERLCATCKEPFAIYVTQSTADGEAHNSSFGLRNCEKHRMKMVPAGSGGSVEEMTRLRSANITMKAELEWLYTHNRELREKLAQYELQPAIERVATKATAPTPAAPTPLGERALKTPDPIGDELRHKWAAKNKLKMPWEAA